MSEKIIEKLLKNLSSKNCLAILYLASALPRERVEEFLADMNELAPVEVLISREFEMMEKKILSRQW